MPNEFYDFVNMIFADYDSIILYCHKLRFMYYGLNRENKKEDIS
jgi:hypothetical protein